MFEDEQDIDIQAAEVGGEYPEAPEDGGEPDSTSSDGREPESEDESPDSLSDGEPEESTAELASSTTPDVLVDGALTERDRDLWHVYRCLLNPHRRSTDRERRREPKPERPLTPDFFSLHLPKPTGAFRPVDVPYIECTSRRGRRAKSKTSRYRGVGLSKGQWVAHITVMYVTVFLGTFDDEELAARAYDSAAHELGFGITNASLGLLHPLSVGELDGLPTTACP